MSDLLNQASLVMVPSGYKEDTVYSVVPSDGSGDLSFTRASNGTRINSAGLVEVCPWNLFLQSEDFSNAAWTKTNTTVTPNSVTAPNGTLTADLIVPANATDGVIVQASLSFIVGTSYSLSVYGKKEDFNFLLLALPSSAFPTSNRVALFDLNNGTIASSTQSGTGAVITDVGNGWYRCSITITATATTSANVVIAARSSNNLTSLGNGTDGIYIWGAQLNTGELKPYFPTTDRLNVPRLTYQNGGGGCPSLLLEKQSTNLALWSEDFTNAIWTKNNATISANATISPDGTSNADKIIPDTNLGAHSLYQSITVTATTYAMSFYAKRAGYTGIRVANLATGVGARFDLLNGVLGTVSAGVTASIENVGNDWYRCIISFTPTAGANLYGFYVDQQVNVSSYAGNGTDGIFVWGAQLEASSYPTSYIPTTSSSATRVADACFKTGISSLIGQTEGVIFADINPEEFQTGSYIGITDGTITNRIIFGFESGSVNSGTLLVFGVSGINGGGTYTRGQRIKIALAYKSGNSALYVNGSLISTATTTFTASFSQFRFDSFGGTQNFIGKVNESILFPTRLTNAELASLTTI